MEYLLNMFPIKLPIKTKRLYFYNSETNPELFAKNLSRVNKIRFFSSNDLVWVELPMIDTKLVPFEINKYKIDQEEVIENDESLFVKTIYSYISKIFLENGYLKVFRKNIYISPEPLGVFKSNGEIAYYLSYTIKIEKIKDRHHLTILPKFAFLSKNPVTSSNVKTSFVFNKISGKTFPVLSISDDELKILVNNQEITVKNPDNYHYNFSSQEAEKFGILKEIHTLYKEKSFELIKNIPFQLSFLKDVIDFSSQYRVTKEEIISEKITYKFNQGTSEKLSEIFKLGPIKNGRDIKFTFFFSSEGQLKELLPVLKEILNPTTGMFIKALKNLGFSKIEFIKNPKTNSSVFYYEKESLEPLDKEIINNIKDRIYAIIILDEYHGNITPLIKNFPQNFILLPVLKKNIINKQIFVINSFAYKALNFTPETIPYYVDIEPGTLIIGIDFSNDTINKTSKMIISAVDFIGKVIYIGVRKKLTLDEKIDPDIFSDELLKILNRYRINYKDNPKRIIFIRDGSFRENINDIEETFESQKLKYAFAEIIKDSTINSAQNLQGKLIKLSNEMYTYFPVTYHNQSSILMRIVLNKTDYTNEKIAETIHKSTSLYSPTPYMRLKLPYTLYINDKIGIMGGEWKFYIPYFI